MGVGVKILKADTCTHILAHLKKTIINSMFFHAREKK